jgi:hypothetical protein
VSKGGLFENAEIKDDPERMRALKELSTILENPAMQANAHIRDSLPSILGPGLPY